MRLPFQSWSDRFKVHRSYWLILLILTWIRLILAKGAHAQWLADYHPPLVPKVHRSRNLSCSIDNGKRSLVFIACTMERFFSACSQYSRKGAPTNIRKITRGTSSIAIQRGMVPIGLGDDMHPHEPWTAAHYVGYVLSMIDGGRDPHFLISIYANLLRSSRHGTRKRSDEDG